jgi:chaperonin GroES
VVRGISDTVGFMKHPFKQVIGRRVMCPYPWKAPSSEHKSEGGLIIPAGATEKDKPSQMKVALSGIETINLGDTVVYNKYHGTTIEVDGQEYLFLKEEEILGVM